MTWDVPPEADALVPQADRHPSLHVVDAVKYPTRAGNDYGGNLGPHGRARAGGAGAFGYRPAIGGRHLPLPLPINESAFPDGLSTTLFVSERRVRPRFYVGPNSYNGEGYASYTGTFSEVPIVSQVYLPMPDADPRPDWPLGGGFGAAHPGTMNALFGDGSVRPVPYVIDPRVWLNLCSRNDGNPVPADF